MVFRNHPKLLKTTAKLIAVALIFLMVIPILQSYTILHPPRRHAATTPSNLGMDYENVVFNSSDGLRLNGWMLPNNESGFLVIVSHGHGSNMGDVLEVAEMLHDGGYSIFMFDFRAHGESEGDIATLGWLETNDLRGAIEYVKEAVNPDKIGVLGFSMGGAVAITTAGQMNDIKAVVADSAFADRSRLISMAVGNVLPQPFGYLTVFFARVQGMNSYENNPVSYAEKISPNALLIIQGDRDHLVEVEDAKLLYDNAKEPKELWLVPDTPHVNAFYTEREEYEKRVLGFFDEYLKG
jgi:fermentation-respiration switch protein FrsA (DUF1100 family)